MTESSSVEAHFIPRIPELPLLSSILETPHAVYEVMFPLFSDDDSHHFLFLLPKLEQINVVKLSQHQLHLSYLCRIQNT